LAVDSYDHLHECIELFDMNRFVGHIFRKLNSSAAMPPKRFRSTSSRLRSSLSACYTWILTFMNRRWRHSNTLCPECPEVR
jgi:hypothetical protein